MTDEIIAREQTVLDRSYAGARAEKDSNPAFSVGQLGLNAVERKAKAERRKKLLFDLVDTPHG